jgi:hypothetical protein
LEQPSNYVKASPKVLASFFYKCNTEKAFRLRFIANPIKTLDDFGIKVGKEAETEIENQVDWLKEKLGTDLGIVPDWGDFGAELLENGWGIRIYPKDDPAAIP